MDRATTSRPISRSLRGPVAVDATKINLRQTESLFRSHLDARPLVCGIVTSATRLNPSQRTFGNKMDGSAQRRGSCIGHTWQRLPSRRLAGPCLPVFPKIQPLLVTPLQYRHKKYLRQEQLAMSVTFLICLPPPPKQSSVRPSTKRQHSLRRAT